MFPFIPKLNKISLKELTMPSVISLDGLRKRKERLVFPDLKILTDTNP